MSSVSAVLLGCWGPLFPEGKGRPLLLGGPHEPALQSRLFASGGVARPTLTLGLTLNKNAPLGEAFLSLKAEQHRTRHRPVLSLLKNTGAGTVIVFNEAEGIGYLAAGRRFALQLALNGGNAFDHSGMATVETQTDFLERKIRMFAG